jgi:hypothetical protein
MIKKCSRKRLKAFVNETFGKEGFGYKEQTDLICFVKKYDFVRKNWLFMKLAMTQ